MTKSAATSIEFYLVNNAPNVQPPKMLPNLDCEYSNSTGMIVRSTRHDERARSGLIVLVCGVGFALGRGFIFKSWLFSHNALVNALPLA